MKYTSLTTRHEIIDLHTTGRDAVREVSAVLIIRGLFDPMTGARGNSNGETKLSLDVMRETIQWVNAQLVPEF